MVEQIGFGETLSASVIEGVRLVLAVVVLSILSLVIYRVVVSFVGVRSRGLGKRKYLFAAGNLGAALLLILLQQSAARLLASFGVSLAGLIQISDESWAGAVLVGLYNTLTATVVLLLLIQIVGASYWFLETWLESRQKKFAVSGTPESRTSVGVHIAKALRFVNKIVRTTVIVAFLLVFVPLSLRYFPRTAVFVDTLGAQIGNPAHDISQEILRYIPNLG